MPVTGLHRSNSYFMENMAIVESYLQPTGKQLSCLLCANTLTMNSARAAQPTNALAGNC